MKTKPVVPIATKRKTKPAKIVKWWKTEQWLNQEQEAFCQCYTMSDRELFGNGVQSYIEIYKPNTTVKNWYKTACVRASQLLSNIKVIKRINELLEDWWFNDTNVDKELSFLISQHSELSTKLWAIKEYNRLKARVVDKLPVQLTYDLTGKSIDEINTIKESLLN